MLLESSRKSAAEVAGVALAALVAAAEGRTVWPSWKMEQQHLQKMHQWQAQQAQPEQMPQQESQKAQPQQVPQQRLQDQQWKLLVVDEQAAKAALASADPLQSPRHHLCPVSEQPEQPVMALAALAVDAVPEVVS